MKTFKTDENHGKLCPKKGKSTLKNCSSTYCVEISDLVLPSFTVFRHLDREFRPLFVTQCEIGWQLPSNSEKETAEVLKILGGGASNNEFGHLTEQSAEPLIK